MTFTEILPALLEGTPVRRECWQQWICKDRRREIFVAVGTDPVVERKFGPTPISLRPCDLKADDWLVS